MSTTLLLHTRNLKVLIRNLKMSLHLLQGLIGNGIDAKLLLALCEAEPQLAPGRVPRSLAEELGHGGAAVPRRERGLVAVERRLATRSCLVCHGEGVRLGVYSGSIGCGELRCYMADR